MADTATLHKRRVNGRVRWELEIGNESTRCCGELYQYFGFEYKIEMFRDLWKFRVKEDYNGGVYFTREKDGKRAIEEYFMPRLLMKQMQVKY